MFESGRKRGKIQMVSEHDQDLFNNLEMFDDDPYANMDETGGVRYTVPTHIECALLNDADDEFDFAEVFN